MSYNNPYRNLLKNALHSFIEIFKNLNDKNNVNDLKMECMQFGICSTANKELAEISHFHF